MSRAEPAVAADGAGITAFPGVKSFQPAPLLNWVVRRLKGVELMWRVYLFSGLIACVVGGLTAFVTVQLTKPPVPQTGPAVPQAGTLTGAAVPQTGGTVILEGEEVMELSEAKVVYYKAPFASPPNLRFPDGLGLYKVTDEKAGSFSLTPFGQVFPIKPSKVRWKAEGQPAK